MSLYLSKFGTVTRSQLPRHLTAITDLLPDNAVIYRQTDLDRYFVGPPETTRPPQLTHVFGGSWVYIGTLAVMGYELFSRGGDYYDPDCEMTD